VTSVLCVVAPTTAQLPATPRKSTAYEPGTRGLKRRASLGPIEAQTESAGPCSTEVYPSASMPRPRVWVSTTIPGGGGVRAPATTDGPETSPSFVRVRIR